MPKVFRNKQPESKALCWAASLTPAMEMREEPNSWNLEINMDFSIFQGLETKMLSQQQTLPKTSLFPLDAQG